MATTAANTTSKTIDLKDVIREEYKKCATNPQYFIRKYVYIQHPVKGRVLFSLYDYQNDAIDDFQKHQYNIVLKGRQVGLSTAVAAYSLWMMLFHRDKNVLVIATKQETAKNLVTKVRFAYDHLPVWLQVQVVENNKLSLRFKNGSQIKATTAAGDAGRSEALSLLIMDEAAFIRNAEEIWVASLPTLSTGGKAIIISTPNGVGNFFHKKYTEATQEITEERTTEDGDEETYKFNAIKLDWRQVPDRDALWEKKTRAALTPKDFRQEYEAEFLGSGNTVIDEDLIQFYAETTVCDPKEKTGFDGNVWVWEYPIRSKEYVVVADVARGDGTDFSAFHVIEIGSCAQVAEYKGKVDTTEFAHMLIGWATVYNDALLVVERENVGWAVLQEIINRSYKNLFYMSKDRQVVEVERNLTNRYNAEEKRMVPGFGTSVRSRPLIISKLDMYMRSVLSQVEDIMDTTKEYDSDQFGLIIRSKRLIEELRVFIWENGKAQAMTGYNDDLVMSLAIGLWVRDTSLKLYQEGISLTRTALEGIRRRTSEVEAVYTPSHIGQDPYVLNIGNNATNQPHQENLRWLLG